MLTIQDLTVSIGEKEIIHSIATSFQTGETVAILGHNGSGKSSLALTLMGHPRYVSVGNVLLDGADISTMTPTDRHALGLFLSFQNIPEIPGIKVSEYLRTVYNAYFSRHNIDKKPPSAFVFRRMLEKMLPPLGLSSSILDRDLFVGFSGGEKRRIELLQIALLDPSYIILDEIDSGLDIDALDILQKHIADWQVQGKTLILITHNFHLLDTVQIDHVLVMKSGNIEKEGDRSLIATIRTDGFQ